MAHDKIAKYKNTYAKLLLFYPSSYQRQFAESMLQTFSDMCHEQVRLGKSLRGFVWKTYLDTSLGILKEQTREVVMNKTILSRVLIVTVGLGALIAVVLLTSSGSQAGVIPPMSSIEQARELSKGSKEACLTDNEQARVAVGQDDGFSEWRGGQLSKFEGVVGWALMDVPAGTQYEVAISSYADGIARGTLTYEGDYGTYNYTIKKLPDPGEWDLVSTMACEVQS